MLLFLDFAIKEQEICPHNLLLFDAESSFATEACIDLYNDLGVTYKNFPSALHQLLDPCGNNFHAAFKEYFYSKISGLSDSNLTHVKRIQIASESYFKVSTESVKKMFYHCGIIGNRDIKELVNSLVDEHSNHFKNLFI